MKRMQNSIVPALKLSLIVKKLLSFRLWSLVVVVVVVVVVAVANSC